MTVTAAYIFLAIVLAPALIEGGLHPMGVHLFILYWAMLSFITPPVALGAFAAASVAGAKPMPTGFAAMQLGLATYLIPFFFVLDEVLIFEGPIHASIQALVEVGVGMLLIAGASQKYLPFFGPLAGGWLRWLTGVSGLLIALPGLETLDLPLTNTTLMMAGFAFLILGYIYHRFGRPVKVAG